MGHEEKRVWINGYEQKWHMNEDPTLQKAHFMAKWIARVKIACHRNGGS